MSNTIVHGRLTVRSSSKPARVVIEAPMDPRPSEPAMPVPCDNDPEDEEEEGRNHDKAVQRELELAVQTLSEEVTRWSKRIPAQLNRYFEEMESQVRAEVVDLSLQIARMILDADVHRQLAVRAALDQAFTQIMRESAVQIRLHPADASRIAEVERAQWPTAATCEADPSLQPGDVVVHTDQGLLDATLGGRMNMLEETIREVLSVEEGTNECHSPTAD